MQGRVFDRPSAIGRDLDDESAGVVWDRAARHQSPPSRPAHEVRQRGSVPSELPTQIAVGVPPSRADRRGHYREKLEFAVDYVDVAVNHLAGCRSIVTRVADRRVGNLAAITFLEAHSLDRRNHRCPATEEVADGVGRQGGLTQESQCRTRRDHVGVVLLGVGGYQYYRRGTCVPMDFFGEFEAVIRAEIDIDQCHVRPQLRDEPERLGAGRRRADNGDSLALEQPTRGVDEDRRVIDD